jgi:asparagine synthase (glutamine-hydrolysing)
MCGIAGFFSKPNIYKRQDCEAIVFGMANVLIHRGPDDEAAWVDENAGIALGHRRLSIIDLSPLGRQPMISSCGRYVIIFNGEIYNFRTLRGELEESGHKFLSHSDTEVMLAAISEWGFEPALQKFIGMFAFALWDRKERVLRLVRDRLGEKPLYYGWMGKSFLFASELKALRQHPDFKSEVNRDALTLYLRHNYIPAPYTIYCGIQKLLPGTVLTLKGYREGFLPLPVSYWSAQEAVKNGIRNPLKNKEEEVLEQLDFLLRDAVKLRMESDVPLGVFLSGGIDSSTVAALMQAQSVRPIKTFTIGFYESNYNEAKEAKLVSRHLGTEHTELYATPKDALDVIPRLPQIYDEPFSDSSQIPTFLVSALTRKYVTVALSGDAGDELFGGYNRYFWSQAIWNNIRWFPRSLRKLNAGLLTSLSPETWDSLFKKVGPFLPKKAKQSNTGDKIHKLAEVITADSAAALYCRLVSHWSHPSFIVNSGVEPATVITEKNKWPKSLNFTEAMMYLDLITYLPDDILTKVDRASMAVSLESRAVFLDHRVVEFAWRLPLGLKIRNNQGKLVLRKLLHNYVPSGLIARPKMGFGVPIDSWLRGPLKEWAESLLDEEKIRKEGFFNPQPIQQKWKEHLSGKRNWQYHLWDILMFEAWQEEWLS